MGVVSATDPVGVDIDSVSQTPNQVAHNRQYGRLRRLPRHVPVASHINRAHGPRCMTGPRDTWRVKPGVPRSGWYCDRRLPGRCLGCDAGRERCEGGRQPGHLNPAQARRPSGLDLVPGRYCSAHQNVAATPPTKESPTTACLIPRVMAPVATAPEVRIGSFSRHFQQYGTPSTVVCAPHRLHFRLMSVTPVKAIHCRPCRYALHVLSADRVLCVGS